MGRKPGPIRGPTPKTFFLTLLCTDGTLLLDMTGKELKAIRKTMNLTQRQLGDLMGVTVTTVARWERSERGISELVSKFVKLLEQQKPERRKKNGKGKQKK